MRLSIRVKLIVAILVPLLVVYLGVLGINYVTGRSQAVSQAQRHLRELAASHAARLGTQFALAENAATSLAQLISEDPNVGAARVDVLLGRAVLRNPAVHGACIALEPGVRLGEDLARYVCRPLRRRRPPPRPARPNSATSLPAPHRARRPRGAAGTAAPRRPDEGRSAPALVRVNLAEASPDCRRETWYLSVRADHRPQWFGPGTDLAPDAAPVARCAVPILREGEFLGVVALDLAVERIQRYVREVKVENGYCMLVDPRGLLVAHPQRALALRESLVGLAGRHGIPQLETMAEAVADGQNGVLEMDDAYIIEPAYVAFAPVAPVGWSFAAVTSRRGVLEPVREWFRRDMAVMLGGLGVIIVCMLLVSIRITRPIASLARAVRELARGNLRVQVRDVRSRDEIGQVARAFNGMVRALRRHVRALGREMAARKAVESELRVARQIQASLLPSAFPRRREFELHAMNVPAREVAGDFFDFFYVNERKLAFLIADVSGKGVPAALFMAVTRTVIRDRAIGGADPARVLSEANRLLARDNERTMFVTLFFGHYDPASGELVYANAGHNPPCLAGADGSVRRLGGSTGPILGVFEEKAYDQRRAHLAPRDALVLYTDGVTEALDPADRQFRLDQLERILLAHPHATAAEVCTRIVRAVEAHRRHSQQDDVTVLVLRRNG